MSERLTHEGDTIFQKKFWELGIFRSMTPASPHCLSGNTIWFILKIRIKKQYTINCIILYQDWPYSMRYNSSTAAKYLQILSFLLGLKDTYPKLLNTSGREEITYFYTTVFWAKNIPLERGNFHLFRIV